MLLKQIAFRDEFIEVRVGLQYMLCFMSHVVCDGTTFTECVLEGAVHVQEAVVVFFSAGRGSCDQISCTKCNHSMCRKGGRSWVDLPSSLVPSPLSSPFLILTHTHTHTHTHTVHHNFDQLRRERGSPQGSICIPPCFLCSSFSSPSPSLPFPVKWYLMCHTFSLP